MSDALRDLRATLARLQSRCPACGRFARYPQDFDWDVVCIGCKSDPRPGVQANRESQIAVVKRIWDRSAS